MSPDNSYLIRGNENSLHKTIFLWSSVRTHKVWGKCFWTQNLKSFLYVLNSHIIRVKFPMFHSSTLFLQTLGKVVSTSMMQGEPNFFLIMIGHNINFFWKKLSFHRVRTRTQVKYNLDHKHIWGKACLYVRPHAEADVKYEGLVNLQKTSGSSTQWKKKKTQYGPNDCWTKSIILTQELGLIDCKNFIQNLDDTCCRD